MTMTLGNLIATLDMFEPDTPVVFSSGGTPGEFASWRGRYEELTLLRVNEPITVGELLRRSRAAVGSTFVGYKGGHFAMSDSTPVWCDDWGASEGFGIAGVRIDGRNDHLELVVDRYDPL
jgi:hypothetical protein